MFARIKLYMCLSIFLPFAGACAPIAGDLVRQLEDGDPLYRIRAITEITRSQRTDLIPNLVDRLEDDDAAVRFAAMFALQDLTGTRLGYDYSAPISERVKSIQAWRDLIDEWYSMRFGTDPAIH